MSDLKIGIAGDLELSNGDLQIISNADASIQFLKQRLKFFYAEWFLDTSLGVPYFQEILKKRPSIVAVDSIFKTVILETVGVEKLLEFNLDYDNTLRKLLLDFTVKISGETINFSEVLG